MKEQETERSLAPFLNQQDVQAGTFIYCFSLITIKHSVDRFPFCPLNMVYFHYGFYIMLP